jgi:hypothetical protein
MTVSALAFAVGLAISGYFTHQYDTGQAAKETLKAQKVAKSEYDKVAKLAKDRQDELSRIRTESEVKHVEAQNRINATLAENRRLARERDGLRDPGARVADCRPLPAGGAAAGPADQSSGGRLSTEAEEFLLEFAAECDRAAEYANTAHDWAVKINPKP